MTQKLPQICTVIFRIRIGKVAWFAVYICGNFWVTQYHIDEQSIQNQWLEQNDSVLCKFLSWRSSDKNWFYDYYRHESSPVLWIRFFKSVDPDPNFKKNTVPFTLTREKYPVFSWFLPFLIRPIWKKNSVDPDPGVQQMRIRIRLTGNYMGL